MNTIFSRASFALSLLLSCADGASAGDPVTRVERGNLVIEGIPEIPAALAERTGRYQQSRGATLEGWLADGSLLITTRFAETAQVHRVAGPAWTAAS